jgi:hypothetical protein
MGISWQSLENPGMKAALGMPKGLTGVFITKTEPMFEASRVLRAGDVLTSFNGEGCASLECIAPPRVSTSHQLESLTSWQGAL